MINFTVSLAGVNIGVAAVHDSTERFCRDYLTDGCPDFCVEITQADIDSERERSRQQDERDGIAVQNYSDNYLETLALYRKIAVPLLDYDTVVFHGSVIGVDGKAVLFTAPSGTGKTTHTRVIGTCFIDY